MGLINLEPTLRDGETVRWRRTAARSLPDRLVRGTLFVTSEALVFMPNRLNRRADLVAERIPRELVTELTIQDREAGLRAATARGSGGLARRLRLTTRAGDVHRFVLRHSDQAITEIRELLGVPPATGPTPSDGRSPPRSS